MDHGIEILLLNDGMNHRVETIAGAIAGDYENDKDTWTAMTVDEAYALMENLRHAIERANEGTADITELE